MTGRALACLAALALLACAPGGPGPAGAPGLTSVRFGAAQVPRGVARSNADLAQDFLDLTFALESGERLEGLLRYETPVRVYLRSEEALGPYRRDLAALLARLRYEAGIDITETRDPAQAQIVIEGVTSAQITRIFPTASCFIVPGETGWDSFSRRRPREHLRWSDQDRLRRAAIFVPLDTTPQDLRDCLHEEVTQALGPANDLYRLPDSIWNDDNFHGLPTAFDMLMLRALYQDELSSGMDRAEVAEALPRILARINPRGRGLEPAARHPESRAWAGTVEAALSREGSRARRLTSARIAVEIAAEMRPPDHRLAVAWLTRGRLLLREDPVGAARDFARAYSLLRDTYGTEDIRTAQAGIHLAALAIAADKPAAGLDIVERAVPAALRGQSAVLLAGLLSLKAEALAALDPPDPRAAAEARLDSLRWARYGFGDPDGALAREQAQVAAELRAPDS